jgi:nucleoside-diphosphate-sugar epimerase
MKILVTGASGFVGTHLCTYLLAKDLTLRILLLPHEKNPSFVTENVEVFRGDLTDSESLRGIFEGIELVYHLGAWATFYGKKKNFFGTIVDGTRNMFLEAEHELEVHQDQKLRFVYISSFAALGLGRHFKGLDETAPLQKCGVYYSDAKRVAEEVVQEFTKTTSVKERFEYVIIRPSNVIGPGSVHVVGAVDAFMDNNFRFVDEGKWPAALTYIDNLIDGFYLAGNLPNAAGEIYFLRDNYDDITWKKYQEEIGELVGGKSRGSLPFKFAWVMTGILEFIFRVLNIKSPYTKVTIGLVGRDLSVDSSKARKELGWKTRVSYEEGMEKIKKWIKETYNG